MPNPAALGGAAQVAAIPGRRVRLRAHFRILRLDHSIKQAFIVPGILLGMAIAGQRLEAQMARRIVVGMLAATLISSSNYVLNELLDAPFDRLHPTKKNRPAARGQVHCGWGYVQWIVVMLAGMALAATVSRGFVLSAIALWLMGCVYNIPPVRSKDLPYIDVLSESINNPLRFLLGWYMVTALIPPLSLLLSYWMLGAYFMALKRFSEYRQIGDHAVAASYRNSFRYYTQESLLNSVAFYASAAMLFFGAFIMRYRMELILAFPIVAWLMAIYFSMSFRPESPVQNPEKLYREPRLMGVLALCIIVFTALLFINIPSLRDYFPKSHP
ncbi:MAG TPA: UbiA family prenyltransferase [Terracidiphilus sp.]|jgi:4-hydroxybenzoate polyprenyltransferase|nr:UbiA family prenyltransferase [Terracidiphilus sp.]